VRKKAGEVERGVKKNRKMGFPPISASASFSKSPISGQALDNTAF
jgi:hypothetical protein